MMRTTCAETIFLFDRELLETADRVPYQPYQETALNHLVPVIRRMSGTVEEQVSIHHGPVRRGTGLWELLASEAPGASGVYQPTGVERGLISDSLHAVLVAPGARHAVGALLSENREAEDAHLYGFLGWFDFDERLADADDLELYARVDETVLTLEKVPEPRYLRRRRPWARTGFSVRWEDRRRTAPSDRSPSLEGLRQLHAVWASVAVGQDAVA